MPPWSCASSWPWRKTSCGNCCTTCSRATCCARWWCSRPATGSRCTAWPRHPARRALAFRHLCRQRGLDLTAVESLLYTYLDAEAVRHAFRVSASLDSMMLGEPQILGQVKDAFALAQACEVVGPHLHPLFSQAFSVAKRVRTETDIARHAVSVSFAAVELAKKIFDGLSGRAVLLVGAGKMSELAA